MRCIFVIVLTRSDTNVDTDGEVMMIVGNNDKNGELLTLILVQRVKQFDQRLARCRCRCT